MPPQIQMTRTPGRLLRVVLAVLIVDLIVSPAVGVALFFAFQSKDKSDSAKTQSEATAVAQYQSCQIGNYYRAQDVVLWEKVVERIDGKTAEAIQFDKDILKIVKAIDVPRTCQAP